MIFARMYESVERPRVLRRWRHLWRIGSDRNSIGGRRWWILTPFGVLDVFDFCNDAWTPRLRTGFRISWSLNPAWREPNARFFVREFERLRSEGDIRRWFA